MTQTPLSAGLSGVSPLSTKNQKNDIAYLTELVSELHQLDSLVALNESRRRLSAVTLQRDGALMEALGGGFVYDPMDYCSHMAVKHARGILVREICAVEHRLYDGASFSAKFNNTVIINKTAFPFGDTSFSFLAPECCRQGKVVKFAKVEQKAGGDAPMKKMRKSSLVFPRPQKKGKTENTVDNTAKDVDEGLGEVQKVEEPAKWNIVAGCNPKASDKSTSAALELENDEYGSIVEKMTDNGNFRMCCKILFPAKTEANNYNMIGRILGPRGISIRQTEAKFDCRILIRGKGSVKNPQDEARLRVTPAGKHLNEALHVMITVEKPVHEQCLQKITLAKAFIEQLLATPDFDEFKRNQLIQLAIINGTYRNTGGQNGNDNNSSSTQAPPSSSSS